MSTPLIDMMIAGAEKAATSSLKDYLGGHPLVQTHASREFTYFVNDADHREGYDTAFERHFGHPAEGRRILAKSVGVMYLDAARRRLMEHNPNVRVVLLLRNPAERAYSAFHFARKQGWETLGDFDAALHAGTQRFGGDWVRARACDYVNRSRYAGCVRDCFETFGRERVRVFLLEDLARDPAAVCSELFNSLGISTDVAIDTTRRANKAGAARSQWLARSLTRTGPVRQIVKRLLPGASARRLKNSLRRMNQTDAGIPPLPARTRAQLNALFRSDILRLSELIGRDLGGWLESDAE